MAILLLELDEATVRKYLESKKAKEWIDDLTKIHDDIDSATADGEVSISADFRVFMDNVLKVVKLN